jgi:hypothetical protein
VNEEKEEMEGGQTDFLASRPNKYIITATLQTKLESHFFCIDQATEQLISTGS